MVAGAGRGRAGRRLGLAQRRRRRHLRPALPEPLRRGRLPGRARPSSAAPCARLAEVAASVVGVPGLSEADCRRRGRGARSPLPVAPVRAAGPASTGPQSGRSRAAPSAQSLERAGSLTRLRVLDLSARIGHRLPAIRRLCASRGGAADDHPSAGDAAWRRNGSSSSTTSRTPASRSGPSWPRRGTRSPRRPTARRRSRCCPASRPAAVLADVRMPRMDGITLLKRAREQGSDAVFVMMTAFASVEAAVEAMRAGAENYLVKPLDVNAVLVVLEKALEKLRLQRDTAEPARAGARALPLPQHRRRRPRAAGGLRRGEAGRAHRAPPCSSWASRAPARS